MLYSTPVLNLYSIYINRIELYLPNPYWPRLLYCCLANVIIMPHTLLRCENFNIFCAVFSDILYLSDLCSMLSR